MKKLTVKNFIFCLILLPFLLPAFGCSKKAYSSGGASNEALPFQMQARTPGLAYDDSLAYRSSAYRDMDNLYGNMSNVDRLEGASDGSATQEYLPYLPNNIPNMAPAVPGTPDPVERKLTKTASFSIRVENLEESDASVTGLMAKYGAYAASTSIAESSRHYSIRVPSTAYDALLAGISGLGKLLHRQENAEDVTLRYYDLEGRLATKRELLKTYQSYLGRARNIEEILSVEAKIAELQNDLEGTGRELRNLAGRVDYASVDLNIQGPVASTPYRGPTLVERFKELFNGFGGFLSVLAVILSGIVIYGVPILLLLVLLFWLLFGKIGLLKNLFGVAAGKPREK
jgi:hypothetical protein